MKNLAIQVVYFVINSVSELNNRCLNTLIVIYEIEDRILRDFKLDFDNKSILLYYKIGHVIAIFNYTLQIPLRHFLIE